MFDYETLKLIWWVLVGVLLIGFALTDGFDLGALVADDDEVDAVFLRVFDDGIRRRGAFLDHDIDRRLGRLGLFLDPLHGFLKAVADFSQKFSREFSQIQIGERRVGDGQGGQFRAFLFRNFHSFFEYQGRVVRLVERCQDFHAVILLRIMGFLAFML